MSESKKGGDSAADVEYMSADRNFLDHYFGSVYNKLEADALLFNRKLPHAGLAGAENEDALAALIRDFLPPRFGVEVSGIVIDRHGGRSRQCDIIIYDASNFPKYLRKVFPVEIVYGVIEVKTTLAAPEAKASRENLRSLAELDFRPLLTNFWKTRSAEERLQAPPPLGFVFGFRSDVASFETFAGWFPLEMVLDGLPLKHHTDNGPEIRSVVVCCLDKGLIKMESTNLHVQRWIPVADGEAAQRLPPLQRSSFSSRSFPATARGVEVLVDPAKNLFLFLETLWQWLSGHKLHPGFDIRSYMSLPMNLVFDMSGVEAAPDDWYMAPKLESKPEGAA